MTAEGEVRGDMKAHEGGYSLFTAIMKWGAIVSFIMVFIVILLIS